MSDTNEIVEGLMKSHLFYNIRSNSPELGELQRGERVVINGFKNVFRASKGGTIFAVKNKWIIAVDLDWEVVARALKTVFDKGGKCTELRAVFRIIKDYPERHFALANLQEFRAVFEFKRDEVEEEVKKEVERLRIDGADIIKNEKVKRYLTKKGKLELLLFPNSKSYRINEEVEDTELREEEVITSYDYEIVGEGELAKLLRKLKTYVEMKDEITGSYSFHYFVNTDNEFIFIHGTFSFWRGREWIEVYRFPRIREEDLLDISRFYVITIPRLIVSDTIRRDLSLTKNLAEVRRGLVFIDVYYNGRKITVILKGVDEIPAPLRFGIRRRRLALSKYARLKLPYGGWFSYMYKKDIEEFNRLIGEIKEILKNYRFKVRDLTKREMMEEIFYIKTPKRKMRGFRDYEEILEIVKDWCDKASLYIVYHGQERKARSGRDLPHYRCFRITPEGSITVLSQSPIAFSGIVAKGGEFERRYRDVYNLDNLIFYKYASPEEKVEMIRADVEGVRIVLRERGMNLRDARFKEVENAIRELVNAEEYPKNIILSFLKYVYSTDRKGWTRDWISAVESAKNQLIGLVKTGRNEDFTIEKLRDVLRVMRVGILWEMKRRGYSPKHGVIFTGTPREIMTQMLRFVKRVEGRMAALLVSKTVRKKEVESAKMMVGAILSRVNALLKKK